MKSTYEKILKLPAPGWDWSPTVATYSEFSPDEQDDLIPLINEEHLDGINEDEISEGEECASIHAYRILGSFLDPVHIPLFIEWIFDPEFEENDLYTEDVIKILPRYQSQAVQPCIDALKDPEASETSRMNICDVLFALAANGIQSDFILKNFSNYISNKYFSRLLNSHIINCLPESEQKKDIDLIRHCFDDHLVDLSMAGDFEELEIKLKIRKTRTTPVNNFFEEEEKDRHLALKQILGPRPSENDPSTLLIYLLDLYGIEGGITNPSGIDGYLTAVLLNPNQQTPPDFIPQIWDPEGEYTPAWEHPDDYEFFQNFILAVQNKITEDLKRRKINPLIGLEDDHSHSQWLSGFLKGFYAWHDDTTEHEELTELEDHTISNIFKILTEEVAAEENNTRPKTRAFIKNLNSAIYKLFKQNYTESSFNPFNHLASSKYASEINTRQEPKISRNSPCPCGSGKKYKRCCMN